MSFPCLFQSNAHFADEVGLALRCLCLLNIGWNARPGAENLTHHYPTNPRTLVHLSTKLNDPNGKFKCSFNDILRWNLSQTTRTGTGIFHF